jgi:hypothetical protein
MKKAAQPKPAQTRAPQPAGRTRPPTSGQASGPIAELSALINGAPRIQAQRKLAAGVQESAVVQGQRKMAERMKTAGRENTHADTQPAPPTDLAAGGGNRSHPAQRVKVSTEKDGNENLHLQSRGPLQMVTVTNVRGGTRISPSLLQTAINYVTEAVRHAEEQEGKESSGDEHKRLKGLLADEATSKPKSSRETFGLGGSQYFKGHPFTTTQGTQEFGQSVSIVPNVGITEHLGNRPTGVHDEIHQITEYPGLQALASTQGHCIFCYGTIHGRGYQHGEMRSDPFPQNWIHDYAGFGLKVTSANYNDTIEYADCPVIKIESTFGTRYYFVTKG